MTLYINCCPRMNSRTDRLARALLKKLGEYEELRLYDEPIRAMDPSGCPIGRSCWTGASWTARYSAIPISSPRRTGS